MPSAFVTITKMKLFNFAVTIQLTIIRIINFTDLNYKCNPNNIV